MKDPANNMLNGGLLATSRRGLELGFQQGSKWLWRRPLEGLGRTILFIQRKSESSLKT